MTYNKLMDILHSIESGNRKFEYAVSRKDYKELKEEFQSDFNIVICAYGPIQIKIKDDDLKKQAE
jgi:hypothetical protein